MNRIDQMFRRRREAGEAAMIFYVTAGFPDLEATEIVIDTLARAGADLIELGIPFSDPIADGPTIQHASYVALEGGVTLARIFDLLRRVRARHPDLPILLFTAYNPVLHLGDEVFVAAAQAAGADGVLVPDLPPEEGEALRAAAEAAGLSMVFLVAPTTTPERAAMICERSTGFVYYISLKGVTGARAALPADLAEKVRAVRSRTDKPVAVGFGVASPAQAAEIASFADGVIIGSALIKLIAETSDRQALAERVHAYAEQLTKAVHGTAPALR